jgi:hypothetical protein
VFDIIKGCKSRDYADGNSALTWDKLKKMKKVNKVDNLYVDEKDSIELDFFID